MFEGRNPWRVDSIEDFYVLECQECSFFTKQKDGFQEYAVKNYAALSHILFSESTIFDQHKFDLDQIEFDADLSEFDVKR